MILWTSVTYTLSTGSEKHNRDHCFLKWKSWMTKRTTGAAIEVARLNSLAGDA